MRSLKLMIVVGLVVAAVVIAQAQPVIKGPFLVCQAGTPPKLTIEFQVLPDPDSKVKTADLIAADAFRMDATCRTIELTTRFLGAVNQDLPFSHSSTHAAEVGKCYKVKVEVQYTSAGAKGTVAQESAPAVCRATLVPTLTEWGLIALGLLLAGSLAWVIRRRFSARPVGA